MSMIGSVALSRVRGLKLQSYRLYAIQYSRTLTSAWIETEGLHNFDSGYLVALSRVRGLKHVHPCNPQR